MSATVSENFVLDKLTVPCYELREDNYHQTPQSRPLPQLSAQSLTGFLEMSKAKGQTAALKSFRSRLGEQKNS